jgi:hypothetical protein
VAEALGNGAFVRARSSAFLRALAQARLIWLERGAGGSSDRMRRHLSLFLTLAVALSATAGVTACGSKTVTDTGANGQKTVSKVKNIHFAKTKFLLHAGLAAGAFHRYIYKPLKSGAFKRGASGQKKALVKAAAAALFTYHELKVARTDAMSSDLLRRKLVRPVDGFLAKLKTLPASLKGGSLGGLGGAVSAFDGLKGAAGGAGLNLKELPTPSLGG